MPIMVSEEHKRAARALVFPHEHSPEQLAAAEALLPLLVKIRSKCWIDPLEPEHWHWRANTDRWGKPTMREPGGTVRAVRAMAWEQAHGCQMPPDRISAVRCDHEDCTSPLCAIATTRSALMRKLAEGINTADRNRKIAMALRRARGVSDEVVAAVRAADLPARGAAERDALAAQYGVSRSAINQWRSNRVRKDYGDPMGSIAATLMR